MKTAGRDALVYAIAGAVIALAIVAILMAIATPAYDAYFSYRSQYQEFQKMLHLASWLEPLSSWVFVIIVPAVAVVWFRFANKLNPAFSHFPYLNNQQRLKAWLFLLISGVVFWFGLFNTSLLGDSVLSGKHNNIVEGVLHVFVMMACSSVSWLLLSSTGFGQFNPGDHKSSWKQRGACLLRGSLFALFATLAGYLLINRGFNFLFIYIVEIVDPSMETSLFGFVWMGLGLMVLMALAFVIIFGMVPIFNSEKQQLVKQINQVRPAMFALSLALLLSLIYTPIALSRHHYKYDNLVEAAGLNDVEPLRYELVQFCGDIVCDTRDYKMSNKSAQISHWTNYVTGFSILKSDEKIPLNPHSIELLNEYILNDGKNSIYRKLAINSLPEISQKLWQPYAAVHAFDELTNQGVLPKGPTLIWPIVHLRWLEQAAPITERNRQDLLDLSNTKKYHISGKWALALARAWYRFGDRDKAQQFIALAKNTAKEHDSEIEKGITLPEATAFSRASITGQVIIDKATPAGVRVGLFVMDMKQTGKKPRISYPGHVVRTVDSVLLDAGGKFSFTQLSDGTYYIALLVPDKLMSEDSQVKSNVPSLISLDSVHPQQDLGTITITHSLN